MNAFEQYADEKGYRGLPKKQEQAAKPVGALEEQQAEKERLARAYRKWKTKEAREVMTKEPRLKAFRRYVRSMSDGDELLEAISSSWLPGSSVDIRLFALRLVDARCQRLRLLAGEEPLDDPWPPETNVYFEARKMLYPGGRG